MYFHQLSGARYSKVLVQIYVTQSLHETNSLFTTVYTNSEQLKMLTIEQDAKEIVLELDQCFDMVANGPSQRHG